MKLINIIFLFSCIAFNYGKGNFLEKCINLNHGDVYLESDADLIGPMSRYMHNNASKLSDGSFSVGYYAVYRCPIDGPKFDISDMPLIRFNFNSLATECRIHLMVNDDKGAYDAVILDVESGHLAPVIDLRKEMLASLDLSNVVRIMINIVPHDLTNQNLSFDLKSIEFLEHSQQLSMQTLSQKQTIAYRSSSSRLPQGSISSESSSTTDSMLILPGQVPRREQSSSRSETFSSTRQSVAHVGAVPIIRNNVELSQGIELEEETQNPVPEPFSILTMGVGLTVFLKRKKYLKNKNRSLESLSDFYLKDE